MNQERYVFIRDFRNIKKGRELTLFRDFVYLDGGMLSKSYADVLMDLVEYEKAHPYYLKRVNIIHNKL